MSANVFRLLKAGKRVLRRGCAAATLLVCGVLLFIVLSPRGERTCEQTDAPQTILEFSDERGQVVCVHGYAFYLHGLRGSGTKAVVQILENSPNGLRAMECPREQER